MTGLGLLNDSAIFSKCRTWRYALWRPLRPAARSAVNLILLNPSTADEVQNDPTVTRCVGFAERWGYENVCVTNLFAFRATDPRDLRAAADPVGPENDFWLKKIAGKSDLVVAAWGVRGAFKGRDDEVYDLLGRSSGIKCLGLTKGGFPRHPLYLAKDTKLRSLR